MCQREYGHKMVEYHAQYHADYNSPGYNKEKNGHNVVLRNRGFDITGPKNMRTTVIIAVIAVITG